ncbi:hypothetical protein FRC01_002874 [Tulasnella sp. 417]|nr:hypothetical protein FRC01_002874 [Tulasnella sp. 417]
MGCDNYPFIKPQGHKAYPLYKSVHGVSNKPIKTLWETIGPLVHDMVKVYGSHYTSIDSAQFITYRRNKEEKTGPVTIWIGVVPGYTTANTAHKVSMDILSLLRDYILSLLRDYDLKDIE